MVGKVLHAIQLQKTNQRADIMNGAEGLVGASAWAASACAPRATREHGVKLVRGRWGVRGAWASARGARGTGGAWAGTGRAAAASAWTGGRGPRARRRWTGDAWTAGGAGPGVGACVLAGSACAGRASRASGARCRRGRRAGVGAQEAARGTGGAWTAGVGTAAASVWRGGKGQDARRGAGRMGRARTTRAAEGRDGECAWGASASARRDGRGSGARRAGATRLERNAMGAGAGARVTGGAWEPGRSRRASALVDGLGRSAQSGWRGCAWMSRGAGACGGARVWTGSACAPRDTLERAASRALGSRWGHGVSAGARTRTRARDMAGAQMTGMAGRRASV